MLFLQDNNTNTGVIMRYDDLFAGVNNPQPSNTSRSPISLKYGAFEESTLDISTEIDMAVKVHSKQVFTNDDLRSTISNLLMQLIHSTVITDKMKIAETTAFIRSVRFDDKSDDDNFTSVDFVYLCFVLPDAFNNEEIQSLIIDILNNNSIALSFEKYTEKQKGVYLLAELKLNKELESDMVDKLYTSFIDPFGKLIEVKSLDSNTIDSLDSNIKQFVIKLNNHTIPTPSTDIDNYNQILFSIKSSIIIR